MVRKEMVVTFYLARYHHKALFHTGVTSFTRHFYCLIVALWTWIIKRNRQNTRTIWTFILIEPLIYNILYSSIYEVLTWVCILHNFLAYKTLHHTLYEYRLQILYDKCMELTAAAPYAYTSLYLIKGQPLQIQKEAGHASVTQPHPILNFLHTL
jgi:hypothetical protein